MTRLIDADALKGTFRKVYRVNADGVIGAVIDDAPTVDAAEVIRCKNCKYYQQSRHSDDWLWCMMNHHYTDEEKYCSWAERKDSGTDSKF